MTEKRNDKFAELLLEHIGRYRISFQKVMEKVFDGQGDVAGAIRALMKAKLVRSLGKAEGFGGVLGNNTAYQLTKIGTAHVGVTEKRAKLLTEKTLEPSFRILWLCCMGKERFARLDEPHVKKLFDSSLGARNNAYCIELGGKRRVYRIHLLGANSTDGYALRKTRKDLLDSVEVPILKDFLEHGRYGNILLVSKPERLRRLQERIGAQGLKNLGHVRVALVPDLNQLKEAMRDR